MYNHNNEEWRKAIESSAYSVRAISQKFSISSSTIARWMSSEDVKVRDPEKAKEILSEIKAGPKRMPYHPSYGYATPDQVDALATLNIGPNRNEVMRTIKKQYQKQGKVL
ncbi:MAG: hypothetical protein IBX55_01235 [Methyloprofundus sp.]|nr:hypothetical protein [Methyloprofundus sp.]